MVAETMEFHPWNEDKSLKEDTQEEREESVPTLCVALASLQASVSKQRRNTVSESCVSWPPSKSVSSVG